MTDERIHELIEELTCEPTEEEKERDRRIAKRGELIDHIDWQIRPPAWFYDQLEQASRLIVVMLASRIMMQIRRTTVAAPEESLATLEAEARRRGSSLNVVLAEAVEEKAVAIRTARRPRVGVARSSDGHSAAELATEPVAGPPS